MKTHFKVTDYQHLEKDELYTILALRQKIFIVEQSCHYLDIDNYDQVNKHVMLLVGDQLIGYARIIAPGNHFLEASFGRFLIAKEYRGKGLADKLIQRIFEEIQKDHGSVAIKIEAQDYLTHFYIKHGFDTISAPYDLEGISHTAMLKKPQ
jgi:ElaA protein